jgi:hypothetical protein
MAGPTSTRSIGSATRIYRNSSNKVIALDDIAIIADTVQLGNKANVFNNVYPGDMNISSRWHRSAVTQFKRMLMHLGVGDRVIAKIQMIGDYKSVELVTGNYVSAFWQGCDDEDDIPVNFDGLPKVGDTL